MRTAIVILTVVASIAAEAPYHLPRPAPHAPAFHYPVAPAPPPPPPPHHHHHHPQSFPAPPASQPITQTTGYNYPQPNFAPNYVQPAPQQQYAIPQPAPLPIQAQPQPLPAYYQPAPAPAPQPIQVIPQPQPQPQPIYYQPPSPSYGAPQVRPVAPQPQPIQQFPSYIPPQPFVQPQPQPQPQPQLFPSFVYQQHQQQQQYQQQQQQQQQQYQPQQQQQQKQYQQQQQQQQQYQPQQQQQQQPQQQYSAQQGYSYPQPARFSIQQQSSQPLQSQALSNLPTTTGLSSYQADSNQYHGAQQQTHREALDSLTVNRVQNIIKENEHTSARDAGYLSLVSGVSLENAKPSVEISSFVHTSPLQTSERASSSALASASTGQVSSPSTDYGLPLISSNVQSEQQSSGGTALSFLPQNKPAISYGPPN